MLKSKAAPNNGMHPTRDTTAVKFLQWPWRAGDAERWAGYFQMGALKHESL
jgi:hypothetical protein